MNCDEATLHLAKRGIKVDKIGKNQFRVWDEKGKVWMPYRSKKTTLRPDIYKDGVWAGREVIALARSYSSDNPQNTAMKKNIKHFDKKNRAATRDLIQKEDFDGIPKEGPVKEENPWNWS